MKQFNPSSNRSHLYSETLRTNALRLIWIVLVIWGELGAFFWSLSACRWPFEGADQSTAQKPTRVLLLSDTQVDYPSLHGHGNTWVGPSRRFLFHLNLKKSWFVTSRLKPHAIIFLGDMLANGKIARNEAEYEQAVRRFKSIFVTDHSVPVYYIPGNNDVSMGQLGSLAKNVRGYYSKAFGPFNQHFHIQNHTFVGLDAPGLVDEDYQRSGRGISFDRWTPIEDGTISFVKQAAIAEHPVILLSHIPLARSTSASCGPLRERGTIRRDVGHGYQSMLGKQSTHFLLENLQPSIVFSGDNRDYCDYTHTVPNVPGTSMSTTPIREVTIKSFSMSVHIRRPGFHLLSLVDPATRTFPGQSSFADTACLLPDQSRIYTSLYGTLAFLTFLLLFVANLRRVHSQTRWRPEPIFLSPSPRSTSGRNTPNAQDSALCSPTWSPNTPRSASPRNSLPATLRFPQGPTGPTLRASSRPDTPLTGSPLLSPSHMTFADRQEDDDEDAMHPAQYASRRDNHRHYEDEEWSDIGRTKEEDEFELVGGLDRGASSRRPLISRFILAPGHSIKSKPPSWSWSFVLAGRRRRITLRVPGWNSLADVRELFDFSIGSRHRRGLLWSTIIDGLNVFYPPLAVWCIIIWILS